MGRITWDALGERRYEIGVDRGVFYRYEGGVYIDGVAWNGLTGVDDESGGRDESPLYSGGVKVGSEYTAEDYSGKIKCYTYPDEFEEFLGEDELAPGVYARQQSRTLFGFTYRSYVGNDTESVEHGYRIHLIYNMKVTDFSRSYSTLNNSTELNVTEISFETFPQTLSDDYSPMSEIIIDSRTINADALQELENILYGTEDDEPRLPYPEEIMEIIAVPEEMPPEWRLYPNVLIYPAETVIPTPESSMQVSLDVTSGTYVPDEPEYVFYPIGPPPIVPDGGIFRRIEFTDIPDEYDGVFAYSGSLSDNFNSLTISYVNQTEESVTVDEAFTVTVTIYYTSEGVN